MSVDEPPRVRFVDVEAADGTRLRAWTNDADGPLVLLCNGLGTNPYAWPGLTRPDCGVRVWSWMHRGIGGSQRPADPARVTADDMLADAVSVLDAAGATRCVAAGWSFGVTTAFELAVRHPERVDGLYALAGVPGGAYSTAGEPLLVPRALRQPVGRALARVLGMSSPLTSPVTSRLAWLPGTVPALRHSGFMLPAARPEHVGPALREFLSTPVDWYMHLARHAAVRREPPLGAIGVPTSFVAGRWDVLAGTAEVRAVAERVRGATYTELRGSHFLPLEQPDEVLATLLELLARVRGAVPPGRLKG